MKAMTQVTIGTAVDCRDGPCGTVTRVVVDPVARAVTHLVVEPYQPRERDRLVPVGLAEAAAGQIRLDCTLAEFTKLDPAEETQFAEGLIDYPEYGPEQAVFWPYFGLAGHRGQLVSYDNVPLGEVEVRRGEHVYATDGAIGRVEGLVIEPARHHVTHVLLQQGHLWGRKDVAIPIGAVTRIGERIQLSITKQQVHDLPPVDIDRRTG